ncbi:bifunctional 2-polyprenyl-6-hydroxyphenol methylase/3-demethylubiquinol 3-O-methyltransferase UbiG [Massilia sp. YIM B02443]|uniref:class I SAM-dependent methyltransferase n=1 Tax=Massilia sp. YIM B02443 TaxID=3050127 RepID=UPI0025B63412|nr:methyltransferase domain-containing protein [Massilia sp. YIM B02443]MDN4035471.1 methyltransferase domain-containing protein [Massilia sp. YIM B02443]
MSQTSFYRAFEDRYRGSRETIKERLRAYAPFTAPLLQAGAPARALDLGCGRGEWLELLGEQGFEAQGVDLDDGMLAACRERGLAARHQDALAALREQPEGSLALVSAFHLVEHLPFELVQDLIADALRALRPGGLLIMETPNPENLTVGATSFYRDPTHVRPLPPDLLGFAADHAGFARQRIVRLQEEAQLHTDAPLGVINVLEGVSPDYAVVAQKTAAAETLAPFDAPFDAAWGITLGRLAQRYEDQRAGQHAEIHHILARLARRDEELAQASDIRLAQLERALHEQREAHAAHQELHEQHRRLAAEQEARIVRAEAHAAEMSQRVVDLLSSSSWRVTEPLRRAATLYYRVRSAQREGRLASGAKARAKRLVRRAGGAVLRRPGLKRLARAALRRVPALEARLYALMLEREAAPVVLQEQTGELSPRAARVYRQLKQEQARKTHADSD